MNKSEEEGITLIMVIITIIVLLILAAVSINEITNNGIMNRAKQTADEAQNQIETQQSVVEEVRNFYK